MAGVELRIVLQRTKLCEPGTRGTLILSHTRQMTGSYLQTIPGRLISTILSLPLTPPGPLMPKYLKISSNSNLYGISNMEHHSLRSEDVSFTSMWEAWKIFDERFSCCAKSVTDVGFQCECIGIFFF